MRPSIARMTLIINNHDYNELTCLRLAINNDFSFKIERIELMLVNCNISFQNHYNCNLKTYTN